MHKLIYFISILAVTIFSTLPADAGEPADTVVRYIAALQNGNIDELKVILGGSLYKSRRALLENNQDYPQFLRQRFQQAQITIEGTPEALAGNKQGVTIQMLFPDGSAVMTKMILEETSPGVWHIINEHQP